MPNSKKLSSKQVWDTLRLSCFNPREPGPLAVVLETGTSTYLRHRAIEEIRKADIETKLEMVKNRLRMAISLLAMAQLQAEAEQETSPKAPKPPRIRRAGRPAQEVSLANTIQPGNTSQHPASAPSIQDEGDGGQS